jgi:hypothetical protein
MTNNMANDLIQKKVIISLNEKGNFDIKFSNVSKYPVGNSIEQNKLSELIKEGISCKFDGDISSDAPKNLIFG